jgi:hypothetical protein
MSLFPRYAQHTTVVAILLCCKNHFTASLLVFACVEILDGVQAYREVVRRNAYDDGEKKILVMLIDSFS